VDARRFGHVAIANPRLFGYVQRVMTEVASDWHDGALAMAGLPLAVTACRLRWRRLPGANFVRSEAKCPARIGFSKKQDGFRPKNANYGFFTPSVMVSTLV